MTGDRNESNENPCEAPSVQETKGKNPASPLTGRRLAASIGLGTAIVLASVVVFFATCSVGAIAGMNLSPAGGEHAMGHGVMTGLAVGTVCSLIVAVLLFRKLFRR